MLEYNGSSVITMHSPYGVQGLMIEYISMGWQKPVDGDKAVVEARISLPAAKDAIRDDFVFGDAVSLCGMSLVPGWGKSLIQGVRTATMTILGDTRADAFEGAMKEADVAVSGFAKIYKDRETRLS
jgi:hypothetical protein